MSSVMDICSQFNWQGPDILTFAGEAIDQQVLENNLLTDWIYHRFHAKASRLDIAIRLDWTLFNELQEATPYDTVQETGWERVRDESETSHRGLSCQRMELNSSFRIPPLTTEFDWVNRLASSCLRGALTYLPVSSLYVDLDHLDTQAFPEYIFLALEKSVHTLSALCLDGTSLHNYPGP